MQRMIRHTRYSKPNRKCRPARFFSHRQHKRRNRELFEEEMHRKHGGSRDDSSDTDS
jgi:hypothetical protein